MVFGDGSGWVHVLRPNFETKSFLGFANGSVQQLWQNWRDILVGVGLEGGAHVVKLWALDRDDRSRDTELQSFPLFHPGKTPCDVTAICASRDMKVLALGLADGTVAMFRGEIERARAQETELVPPGPRSPITALCLDEGGGGGGGTPARAASAPPVLYVVTERVVLSFPAHSAVGTERLLESVGGQAGQVCLAPGECGLMVGRPHAVQCYDPESRG